MYRKFLLFVVLSMSLSVLYAQSDLAQIRELSGKVEIKAPNGSWVPASVGMRLDKNTDISTGFNSSAVVALGESLLTVKALTRLSLEEIIRREESETVSLHLLAGRVRAEVKPPAGSRTQFTVRSATATASVRGTSFEFDTVNLNVTDGIVSYSSPRGGPAVPVVKGERSTMDTGGVPSVPVSLVASAASIPELPEGIESILSSIPADVIPPEIIEYFGTVNVTINWDEGILINPVLPD